MIDDFRPDPTLSLDDGDREGMTAWLDRMHDYLNEKFDAEFPRLERYLKIVVDSREATEAPGTDAFDRERGFNIGVESTGFILKKAKLKLGVRSSIDLFGAIIWSPNFRGKRWLIEPTVSGYYRRTGDWAPGWILW